MVRPVPFVAALTLLIVAFAFDAESAAPPSLTAEANAAFQAQDWQAAAHLYAKIVESKNDDTLSEYRLGISLMKLGRDAEALNVFQEAEANVRGSRRQSGSTPNDTPPNVCSRFLPRM
jgi:Flp pilus assembly protein TadD